MPGSVLNHILVLRPTRESDLKLSCDVSCGAIQLR